jgi:adenylate kinase family enzyme
MDKEILKQWGENTAYSAKSHFKTADLKRTWIKSLVIINVLFAIFSLIGFQLPIVSKIFGIISLVASILILVYESQENKSTIKRHMSMGDEYLDIHYQLQELFFKDKFEDDDFDDVKERIQKLNKKDKPIINQIAKWQAKSAIEKKGEMTKWWK